MKHILLPTISLLLVTGSANADAINYGTDWSGGYVGLGVSFNDGSYDANSYSPPNVSGPLGSAMLGYNFQKDRVVYGVEAVLNFGNIEETTSGGCGVGATSCRSTIEQYAAIRGRVGYAFDQTLAFVTLGLATDRQSHQAFGIGSDSERHYGYTIGIGAEQSVGQGWSIRGDLEYYDFGTRTYDFAGGTEIEAKTTAARISIVKRF
jgi:outer membrane immunogenic protein